MISTDSINTLYVVVEHGRFIDDELYEVVRSRLSGKQLEFLVDGDTPRNNNPESNLQSGIYEPLKESADEKETRNDSPGRIEV